MYSHLRPDSIPPIKTVSGLRFLSTILSHSSQVPEKVNVKGEGGGDERHASSMRHFGDPILKVRWCGVIKVDTI